MASISNGCWSRAISEVMRAHEPEATAPSGLPRVAVLLAAYEGMSWLEEQLASILAQTGVSVTIYISVDPSSDGTEAWCADYASTHSQVVLLPSSGPFRGASRNFFRLIRDVEFSEYDYVAFSDQDDIWYCDKLERAVSKLHTARVDGYSSNVRAIWPDGRRILVDKAQPQVEWDFLFEAAGPGCTYVLTQRLACAFKHLISRAWTDVQSIDLHDWFCYAFARSQGFKWFIDPLPGMDYRQHASNQVGVNSGFRSAIARWRKIADGWWFRQICLTAMILKVSNPYTGAAAAALSTLRVARDVRKCRRRPRDRVVLLVVCLLQTVAGRR